MRAVVGTNRPGTARKAMASAIQAASHLSAPPPELAADLQFLATLPADSFAAFAAAARELLRSPDDVSMFGKAARQLGASAETVGAAVRALCYVLVSAASAGRPADELLEGVALELPAELLEALRAFYADVLPELQRELQRGVRLPEFRGLEWRLQLQCAGRYAPRQAPRPGVLFRLRTGADAAEATERVFQADLPNLRRLASELEGALAEERATHSRRIARRL